MRPHAIVLGGVPSPAVILAPRLRSPSFLGTCHVSVASPPDPHHCAPRRAPSDFLEPAGGGGPLVVGQSCNGAYRGPVARKDCERALKASGEHRDFVVRESETDPGSHSITMRVRPHRQGAWTAATALACLRCASRSLSPSLSAASAGGSPTDPLGDTPLQGAEARRPALRRGA